MTTQADVLAMIEDGGKCQAIADLTQFPKGYVVQVAREAGFALNVSSDRFQRVAPPKPKPAGITVGDVVAPAEAPSATTATANQSPVTPSSPLRPAHRDLIDEGKASTVTRVQRAAVKAEQALETLTGLLEATRAQEAERRRQAEERARLQADVERLQAELDAKRAALRAPRAKAAPVPNAVDAKTVRAWAREAGVECPASGRVPQRVVDAYLAQRGAA